MLEITLVRHAKSSWSHPELSDFDRPLKKRGTTDAALVGQWMLKHEISPEQIISSGAQRATSTAQILAKALSLPPKAIRESDKLYFSGCQKHLQVIHEIKDKLKSVLIVGHNPIISTFAEKLTGSAALGEIPTAATVNIHFDCSHWQEIAYEQGQLRHYVVPKSLRD